VPSDELKEPAVIIVEGPPRADPEYDHPDRPLRTGCAIGRSIA
jgi:hypothetical protein